MGVSVCECVGMCVRWVVCVGTGHLTVKNKFVK